MLLLTKSKWHRFQLFLFLFLFFVIKKKRKTIIINKNKKKKKERRHSPVLKIKTKKPNSTQPIPSPSSLTDFWENNWQNSEKSRRGKGEGEIGGKGETRGKQHLIEYTCTTSAEYAKKSDIIRTWSPLGICNSVLLFLNEPSSLLC